jgi:hypothetical protein
MSAWGERRARHDRGVTIWVVRDDDDLYVRSADGPTSAWFRGTQVRHEGRRRLRYVDPMVTPEVRATTLRLVPR